MQPCIAGLRRWTRAYSQPKCRRAPVRQAARALCARGEQTERNWDRLHLAERPRRGRPGRLGERLVPRDVLGSRGGDQRAQHLRDGDGNDLRRRDAGVNCIGRAAGAWLLLPPATCARGPLAAALCALRPAGGHDIRSGIRPGQCGVRRSTHSARKRSRAILCPACPRARNWTSRRFRRRRTRGADM